MVLPQTLDAIVNSIQVGWESRLDLLREDGFDFTMSFAILPGDYQAVRYSQDDSIDVDCVIHELIRNSFKSIYCYDDYEVRKLADNVKFKKIHGEINVQLVEKAECYHLSVHDNGDGIPLENYERVFQDGFSTRGTTGIGLGLAKARIVSLGGKLYFQSKVGVGTTFYVELPKDPATVL